MPVKPWQQLDLDLEHPRSKEPAPFGVAEDQPEAQARPTLTPAAKVEAHVRRIAGHLTVKLPEPVDLVLTDNRSTMISYRRRGGRLHLRLHRMFQHADHQVLDALATYVSRRSSRSSRVLDTFIAEHRDELDRSAKRKSPRLLAQGRWFDLSKVLHRVGSTYFGGPIDVGIGWGQVRKSTRRRRRGVRSRALATYSFFDKCIRVSPVLDAQFVPEFVMDWIVYHEILHHVLPVEGDASRKVYHSARFRCLERAFPRFEEARSWERANLDKLLS
ncbi:MAG: hypothetical protein MUC50_21615 [Myxococcota bacterium]|nr:hypothetical protein [Myxococcota bacterium]